MDVRAIRTIKQHHRRAVYRETGRCEDCGKPKDGPYASSCVACRGKALARERRLRAARVQQGQCGECGRAHDNPTNALRCKACAGKNIKYNEKFRGGALPTCAACDCQNKVTRRWHRYCKACRANRVAQRKHDAREAGEG